MSRNVFIVSDTHFGHSNIIRYSLRPFATVEEHDETLIQNWNKAVSPNDDVFFLGDFAYRNKDAALTIRKRLNGTIYFIEGNHDSSAFQIRHTFAWYKQLHKITIGVQEIVLCHYAMKVWNKSHHNCWHLYGHSHASLPDDKYSKSFDVGVDNTAIRLSGSSMYGSGEIPTSGLNPKDYRPISFDEVTQVMATKVFRPLDHHD